MGERVLILGTTGVNKSVAMANLRKYAETQSLSPLFEAKDFEKDFLAPVLQSRRRTGYAYLDSDVYAQRELWLRAWADFEGYLHQSQSDNFILCLHGVLTRPSTGTRSPIDIPSIQRFKPTSIVVLIDDVYMKWHRTNERAHGSNYRGVPTIEQLLDARRSEIVIARLISSHISDPIPNFFVLSVNHPARTLYRILFTKAGLSPIYLSFPISDPRRRLAGGDVSGVQEVNSFLKRANQFELSHPKAVCFCPLTIDELPLRTALQEYQAGSPTEKTVKFDMRSRWDVREFWPDEVLLCDGCEPPGVIELIPEEVMAAVGLIEADVALRDYQLVRQAAQLAVFNPWSSNQESRGVRNEIQLAIHDEIPCQIYQNPEHDANMNARSDMVRKGGALGRDVGSNFITFNNSIDEMFEQLSYHMTHV